MRVAFDDLVEEFARDHERDASFGRIGTLHRVHIAEARGASEVPAPARALDGVVGKRIDAVLLSSAWSALRGTAVRLSFSGQGAWR